jgi:DnaJ-class molecular chaperone
MNSAASGADEGDPQQTPARECMACRGSGKVISHLGGEAKTVTCPWCDGSGTRGAIFDAQARWRTPEENSETT